MKRCIAERFFGAHRARHAALPAAGKRHDARHRPLGGSYYVEHLTGALAAKALAHIEEIETAGGMAKAIEAGIPKRRIEEPRPRHRRGSTAEPKH